jgi:hypothetical protein
MLGTAPNARSTKTEHDEAAGDLLMSRNRKFHQGLAGRTANQKLKLAIMLQSEIACHGLAFLFFGFVALKLRLIPRLADQNRYAQSRIPMNIMRQG